MKQIEMKRYGKLLLNVILYLVAGIFLIFVMPKIINFFMPFVIGGIIAAIANPLVKIVEKKLKIKRKASTVFVIVTVLAIVCGLGYLLISILLKQSVGLMKSLPALWNQTKMDFDLLSQKYEYIWIKIPQEWKDNFTVILEKTGEKIAQIVSTGSQGNTSVGNVVENFAGFIISLIMCVLSAYFFIADKEYLTEFIKKYTPASFRNRWDVVYSSMKQAAGGYFKAQFRIEIWIYLLLLAGLTILGINYAILIALGIAVLDFLPFFGTGIVMIPWGIISFFTGDYVMGIGLVVIWGVSQFIRQLIQPKIMGDSIGMPSIPTLFLLFIGYRLGGVLGMIFAVPIGIIFVNLNQAGVFDTLKLSMKLLIANINQYRRLSKEDLEILDEKEEGDEKDGNIRY